MYTDPNVIFGLMHLNPTVAKLEQHKEGSITVVETKLKLAAISAVATVNESNFKTVATWIDEIINLYC